MPTILVIDDNRAIATIGNNDPDPTLYIDDATVGEGDGTIELTVRPERIYILSFCEVDSQLHFHLFPRTGWLLREYRRANGGEGEAVDGPALFQWAKRSYLPGAALPAEGRSVEALLPALRGVMEEEL